MEILLEIACRCRDVSLSHAVIITNMYPILARFGPFFLYSYTVILGIGTVTAVALLAWRLPQPRVLRLVDAVLLMLVAALLLGRAFFVWGQWPYFQENPQEIWQIWQGGLSYHGALWGGGLALWVYCRQFVPEWRRLLFSLSPPLAWISAWGWLACWFEGCAYGKTAWIGLLTADLPDSFGVYAVRYRVQLIGLIACLIIAVVAWGLQRRRLNGPYRDTLFWLTLFALTLVHGALTIWRGDPMPRWLSWRFDTWADGITAVLAVAGLWLSRRDVPHE